MQTESITVLLVTNISHHSTLSYSIFLVFKSLNGFFSILKPIHPFSVPA